ncbi:hypothetical protein RRG08_052041 [Elysia crispata]|uniref:Secreted protein n=1 Tax=Elysia crispata TaxID=231223 RepID=A0AAE1DTB3_9GAST|nr:hypothetical protein RRG08_052041 [Elysia crispata]
MLLLISAVCGMCPVSTPTEPAGVLAFSSSLYLRKKLFFYKPGWRISWSPYEGSVSGRFGGVSCLMSSRVNCDCDILFPLPVILYTV